MKWFFLPALLVTTSTLLAAPEDRTAKAVKALAESLAGKEVSVEVTHVASLRTAGDETCSVFAAHTFDTGENLPAGSIFVAVKKDEHEAFVKKFGATPEVGAIRPFRDRDTTRLTGTLRLTDKKVPYIDLTGGLAGEKLLAKAAASDSPSATTTPREKARGNAGGPGRARAPARR